MKKHFAGLFSSKSHEIFIWLMMFSNDLYSNLHEVEPYVAY